MLTIKDGLNLLEANFVNEPSREKTLWTLRKVSTRISLSTPRRLTRKETFCLQWIFCFRNHYPILYPPETECVGPDQSVQTDLDRYITQRP